MTTSALRLNNLLLRLVSPDATPKIVAILRQLRNLGGKRCQEPFGLTRSRALVKLDAWADLCGMRWGGIVYHVLNRANARATLFEGDADYLAFENVLWQAHERTPVRILAYCVMPNHWHMLVWPHEDGQLSDFVGWLTLTHVQRWHAHRQTSGYGHLYQGRFKSFPVESDAHFLTVARYVERNALRANLVSQAEDWRWCSLWRRCRGDDDARALLAKWPIEPPRDWLASVNRPETPEELDALRICLTRGRPFGSDVWLARMTRRFGLETTLRPRGRPRKRNATSGEGGVKGS